MKTNSDYTVHYKCCNIDYGMITVPKGTPVTNQTALGIDKNYHFVNSYGWVKSNYPEVASILIHDLQHYGLNVPKEFIDFN